MLIGYNLLEGQIIQFIILYFYIENKQGKIYYIIILV